MKNRIFTPIILLLCLCACKTNSFMRQKYTHFDRTSPHTETKRTEQASKSPAKKSVLIARSPKAENTATLTQAAAIAEAPLTTNNEQPSLLARNVPAGSKAQLPANRIRKALPDLTASGTQLVKKQAQQIAQQERHGFRWILNTIFKIILFIVILAVIVAIIILVVLLM